MDLFAPKHLLLILAITLLVFGTKKLKTLGSDLGGAVRGFKEAMRESEPSSSSQLEIHRDPEARGSTTQR